MKIKNKEILKIELKKQIDEYIDRFPIYFYGSIFINLFFFAAISLIIISFLFQPVLILFVPVIIIIIIPCVLFDKRFFEKYNYDVYKKIRAGRYNFEINDHEMDNVVEFIAELPMKREEAERLRVALCFNRSLDSLEKFGIITFENGLCDIDLKFKYRIERAEELAGLNLNK